MTRSPRPDLGTAIELLLISLLLGADRLPRRAGATGRGCGYTCDRCHDVGKRGVPMIGVAIPPAASWPAFQVCQPCADELAKPAFEKPPYVIMRTAGAAA